MLSVSDKNQADSCEAVHSTSRYMYLEDLLNIDNPSFAQIISQIFATELPLNKANTSDNEAWF